MKKINILLIVFGFMLFSCKEDLELLPVDQIGDELVIEDMASLEAAVLGMYSSMQSGNMYGELEIFMGGILSDEMVFTGTFPTKTQMAVNEISAENVTLRGVWSQPYRTIFIANTIIERAANAGTAEEIAPLVAEAKLGRALSFMNLVKFWGGVPLTTTSDVNVNSTLPRASVAEVYAQIISDLTDAVADLPGKSVNGTYRATKAAAQALMARAYLYSGDLPNAGIMANTVITSNEYSLDPDYANLFSNTSTSPEIIFNIFASIQDGSALGFFAQPASLGGRYDYSPNPTLLAEMDAEDVRAELIVPNPDAGGILVTNKYTDANTGTDKPCVIRLAEMYLIRAEANGSVGDLNTVAARATGNAVYYNSYNLDNLLRERKLELAFEGHRWHDLVRTNQANAVLSVLKPDSWDATDVLMPIPQREIEQNPSLVGNQNPGY